MIRPKVCLARYSVSESSSCAGGQVGQQSSK